MNNDRTRQVADGDIKSNKRSDVGSNDNQKKIIGSVLIVGLLMFFIFDNSEKPVEKESKEEFNPASKVFTDFTKRIEVIENKQKKKSSNTIKKIGLSAEKEALLLKLIDEKKKAADLADISKKKAEAHAKTVAAENKKRQSQMMVFSSKQLNAGTSDTKDSGAVGLNGLSLLGLNSSAETNQSQQDSLVSLPEPQLLDVVRVQKIRSSDRTLTAGKFIAGILETAIVSTLPGQIRAIVSNDVYSDNGTNLLIEKGTRLIGEYQSRIAQGQSRIFVIWNTAITPNGYQVPLSSLGTNQLGVSGLSGDYDSHFIKRFGGALLLSLIENYNNGDNQLNVAAQSALSRASSIALNNTINIPPTIYVDQGEKINIFVARNIEF